MSSVKFRDSDGNVYYLNMADGAGTAEDPFVGPGDASALNLPVYVTQSGDGTAQEVYITGCLMVKDCTGLSGVVEGLLVTGDITKPLYIHDGGNSLTVDNTQNTPLHVSLSDSNAVYPERMQGMDASGRTGLYIQNDVRSGLTIDNVKIPQYGAGPPFDEISIGLLVTGEATNPLYANVTGVVVAENISGSPLYVHINDMDGGASLTVDNTQSTPIHVSLSDANSSDAWDRPQRMQGMDASGRTGLYVQNDVRSGLTIDNVKTWEGPGDRHVAQGLLVTGEVGNPLYVENTSSSPLYIETQSGLDVVTRPMMARNSDFIMDTKQASKTVFAVAGTGSPSNTLFNTPDNAGGASPHSKYIVKAPTTNDVAIWIGGHAAYAEVSGEYAFPIYPGESHEFHSVKLDFHYGVAENGGHVNNSLYIYAD
jgi:hypothetical protein